MGARPSRAVSKSQLRFSPDELSSKDGFFGILEGRHDILGDLFQKFSAPEWVRHVIVNHPNMMEVKGHILVVRRHQNHGFVECVGYSQFVKHVRVPSRQLSNKHSTNPWFW